MFHSSLRPKICNVSTLNSLPYRFPTLKYMYLDLNWNRFLKTDLIFGWMFVIQNYLHGWLRSAQYIVSECLIMFSFRSVCVSERKQYFLFLGTADKSGIAFPHGDVCAECECLVRNSEGRAHQDFCLKYWTCRQIARGKIVHLKPYDI